MEGWTSIKGRVWPGKTVSPRPTELRAWAYKDFKIEDLFSAQTGDTDLQQKDINGRGTLFINSGVEALGIKGKTDREAKVFDSNTITIDFWGNAYYRDFEYKMATHNHVFSLSGDVIKNRNIGLYLVSTMSYMRKLFSYNNMGTWSKIKEQYIHLPVTKKGNIDFVYMESRIREMEESRIREMEESRIREMEAYLKVAGFEVCELTVEEKMAYNKMKSIKTKEFKLGDLYNKVTLEKKAFDKRKDSRQMPDSQYCLPLVNAKHGDNGIMYYGDPNIFDSIEMTIDIVQNGAIATGDVYPQPQRTGILWDAYLIQASHHQDNAETLMYFSTVIAKSIKKKYTYDNKAYWEQVKEDKIILPITPSGEIDYKFMEIYIRAQEKLAIQRVKDWRAREIVTTKDIINCDSKIVPLTPTHTNTYTDDVDFDPMMVAEDIFIPGSLEVRLRDTRRDDLLAGTLELVLMYAIGPTARKKTESSGKIALGIKEGNLSSEAIKAYESVKYIMFHYWKNSEAKPFELTKSIRLVSKSEIPDDYLLRQEKDAKQYLLIEYDNMHPINIEEFDILKAQRKGSDRYIPFVCKVDNIKDNNDD